MSADNYYTVKFSRKDLLFYACHGFMSDLEDGIPALISEGTPGYDHIEDAINSVVNEYSEYGVIQEDGHLASITSVEEWKTHLEDTIRFSQEHLAWINGEIE